MSVEIVEVKNRKLLRSFIHLPAKIHKSHSNWVPPIYMDDWTFFNPEKNRAFDTCDTILLLAFRDKKCVGRCMGLISHEYNKEHNENHARFAFMETWNESEVFDALIDYIARWGRNHGMDKLVGPLAFSDKDPQGFLFEGYDQPVVIATNCNFPYMVDLTEGCGFTKKVDCVVYQIPIPEEIPEFYIRIADRAKQQNGHLRMLEFTSRRKLKPFIRPVFNLINLTFGDIYGFIAFTEQEMNDFANRYLFLIDPRYVKVIVTEQDEVIAFVIAMDDISRGIRRSHGYLFPIGFIHLLRAAKKSHQLNLLLGAIDPHFQGQGLDVLLGMSLIKSAKESGKTTIDSHLELEYNTKVRAEMEKMGGVVYKRFRIYQKEL
ncbi:MAG TPA: hypothetical protein VF298_02140 [Bacteroidales bacterium]